MSNQISKNGEIIIRDKDGTYKVLRDGKFVPLNQSAQTTQPASTNPPKLSRRIEKDELPVPKEPVSKSAPKPVAPVNPRPIPQVKSIVQPSRKTFAKNRPQIAPQQTQKKQEEIAKAISITAQKVQAPRPSVGPRKPEITKVPTIAPEESLSGSSGFADRNVIRQAETILIKSGVTFPSKDLRERTVKCIVSHLKGVRKPFETKDCLTRDIRSGGCGLVEPEVSYIMNAITGKPVNSVSHRPVPVASVKPQSNVRPIAPIVGKEVAPPPSIQIKQSQPRSIESASTWTKPEPARSLKPAISDVSKPASRVRGPVEELSYTLNDWRRLADNPTDRMKKIENQLSVLEKDSFPKRFQGVKAWRSSEVYRMYVESGQKSFEQGKPLSEVILKEPLDYVEWQAIAQANKNLTF